MQSIRRTRGTAARIARAEVDDPDHAPLISADPTGGDRPGSRNFFPAGE